MTYAPEPAADGTPPGEPRAGARRRGAGCLLEVLETLVLTLVIYLLIHTFVAQPFEVEQESMIPTINPNEYVLIDKITPRFDTYRRGDIVVFNPTGGGAGSVPFIKRVIGLPGDTVRLENGRVWVEPPGGIAVRLDEPYVVLDANGATAPTLPRDPEGTVEWVIPAGHYFVLGDNRVRSQDSRVFGPITQEQILGRAFVRYFPLDRVGIISRPTYDGLPDRASPQPTPAAWWWSYPRGGSSATIQVSISRG